MTTLSSSDRRAVLRVLKKARVLIRKGWTQGTVARSAIGNRVIPSSRHAVQWCPLGALEAADGTLDDWYEAIAALGFRNKPLAAWNDAKDRTKAQVLARFDKAITRLEAQA